MEAVKQGSATVGLKSKAHAVLVALKVFCFTSCVHVSGFCEGVTVSTLFLWLYTPRYSGIKIT